MKTRYRANGKLLISGEYFILDGATALVLPIAFGQELLIEETQDQKLSWKAFEKDDIWFDASFELSQLKLIDSSDQKIADYLEQLLRRLRRLNENAFARKGFTMCTTLDYNRYYGWGSSSTLISLLAKWAQVNPYELNDIAGKGSGYDIAAAGSNSPFLYALNSSVPAIRETDFNPPFADNLYFVYLGKKQKTAKEVSRYQALQKPSSSLLSDISKISLNMSNTIELEEFKILIQLHEYLVGKHIGVKPVKQVYFSDFEGDIKSLGAWGGDFAMFVTDKGQEYLENYLLKKNLSVIYSFDELRINNTA